MASNYIYASAANSALPNHCVSFYETATAGIFDGVGARITTSNVKVAESSLSRFRLVLVPIGSSYRKVYWSATAGTAYVTNTDFGMLTWLRNTTTTNKGNIATTSGSVKVTIIDEHGTNIGTPTLTSGLPTNQFFGSKHSTTASGWIYAGCRVTTTSSSSSRSQHISTGGTTEGTTVTYPADYAGAIVLKAGSVSETVTIEYLYTPETPTVKTVTFNPNGGTVSPTSREFTVGLPWNNDGALPTPTHTTKDFTGWFDAQEGGNQIIESSTFTDSSPTEIFAHWSSITKTITFNGDGGTPATQTMSVVVGDQFGTLPSVTKSGKVFSGWFSGQGGAGYQISSTTELTKEMATTFYAYWTDVPVVTYTVTFDGGEGATNVPTPVSGEAGTDVQIPDQTPEKTDYTFNYWEHGQDQYSPGDFIRSISGDMTLTANWTYVPPTPPPGPRPESEKGHMVYGGSSGMLTYSVAGGSLVYAV